MCGVAQNGIFFLHLYILSSYVEDEALRLEIYWTLWYHMLLLLHILVLEKIVLCSVLIMFEATTSSFSDF